MHALMTGASGLIGSALTGFLTEKGHQVTPLKRLGPNRPAASGAWWNPAKGEIDLSGTKSVEAAIHLAGETIAGRWTSNKKARIHDSRVCSTKLFCEALAQSPNPPKVLVSASGIGYYGDRGDELLDERSASGTGFLAQVCREWEAATRPASARGIRVVNLRFGVVLDPRGGALSKMLLPFRLGLGGKMGSGKQYWSWIALEDVLTAIYDAVMNENLAGPFNAVSPNPVTNREFTGVLGRAIHRPTFFSVPAWAVRVVFGEMGQQTLLASARVRPARLEETGFVFKSPYLEAALLKMLAQS
jgi:uncharacterized protein (TIGR01777 family)